MQNGHAVLTTCVADHLAMEPLTVRLAIHVDVPPDEVFGVLDSEDGRARFWAESAIETDGVIDFHFINGWRHRARILVRERPTVWSVQYFGGPARFQITADGRGGADVVLTHDGVAPCEFADVFAGWVSVLLPLKVWLLAHVDVRNHDPLRTWDQGYVDQ